MKKKYFIWSDVASAWISTNEECFYRILKIDYLKDSYVVDDGKIKRFFIDDTLFAYIRYSL